MRKHQFRGYCPCQCKPATISATFHCGTTMTDLAPALPEFDDVADDFYALESISSPSAYHGLICGRVCANQSLEAGTWQASVMDFLGLAADASGGELERVIGLQAGFAAALADEGLGFDLLLPPDDYELRLRAEALGQWCEGFLMGLAFSGQGQKEWEAMPAELAEGLTDMATIAQISADDDEQSSERDLVDVSEYVRMVVLNVYAELVLQHASEEPEKPSHAAEHFFKKNLH